MNATATAAHTFTAAGCRNQWHADHNDSECMDVFYSEKRPGLTCGCPSDCGCHSPFKMTVCGCHQH